MLNGKHKALFIAANHWTTSYRVGSYELASRFAENNWEVAFVSDPVSPFHFFKLNNEQVSERFRIWLSGGRYDKVNKTWYYVPFTLFPPQKYPGLKTRFVFENWHKFTVPNVLHKVMHMGFHNVDLLYFDNANQGIWLNYIKYKKSVFRIADNYSGYEKYTGYSRIMQDKLAKNVDLVLYTAKKFENYINSVTPKKSLFFPNGVDFDSFANGSKNEPEDLKHISHPRIIYIGEMEIRFDFELIKYAAGKLPGFSFILIGNDILARREFREFPNIYVLGIKKNNELPAYLHNSDVGIIPFNVRDKKDLIKYVNPIKLHQYFACGLPVVSARWEEIEDMHTPAFLYNNYDEFIELLKKALEDKTDKKILIESARLNDWKSRYRQLIDELEFE